MTRKEYQKQYQKDYAASGKKSEAAKRYYQKHKYEICEKLKNAVKNNDRIPPTVSNSALQDNSKLVDNMCMSYRHDFGLMAEQDKQSLRFECKEWLRAYENNREHCC